MSRELATNLDAELLEYAGKVLAAIRGIEHSDRDSSIRSLRLSLALKEKRSQNLFSKKVFSGNFEALST